MNTDVSLSFAVPNALFIAQQRHQLGRAKATLRCAFARRLWRALGLKGGEVNSIKEPPSPVEQPEGNDEIKLRTFLVQLVDAPAKNLVGMVDDWLKYFRYKNLLSVQDKVRELHLQRNLEGKTNPLPPKYAVPLLEACSLETEPDIQSLWAQLIANATDPEFRERYHPSYVEIIKQLASDEALVLQRLTMMDSFPVLFAETTRTRANLASGHLRGESPILVHFEEFVKSQHVKHPERALNYLNNLERLKLIEIGRHFSQSLQDSPFSSLRRGLSIDEEFGGFNRLSDQLELEYSWQEEIRFSRFGVSFCQMCFANESQMDNGE